MIVFSLSLSDGVDVEVLLHNQRVKMLPIDRQQYQRVVVRHKHLWKDALYYFKSGMCYEKYIRVTFMGEPAVDEGGPLCEFLHLLMAEIASNNNLFCGREDCRIPTPISMVELEKHTFKFVGNMISVSLIHGGPAPTFLAPSVVDCIIHGMGKERALPSEVPVDEVRKKLEEV